MMKMDSTLRLLLPFSDEVVNAMIDYISKEVEEHGPIKNYASYTFVLNDGVVSIDIESDGVKVDIRLDAVHLDMSIVGELDDD